jgi:hypothetical protein
MDDRMAPRKEVIRRLNDAISMATTCELARTVDMLEFQLETRAIRLQQQKAANCGLQ